MIEIVVHPAKVEMSDVTVRPKNANRGFTARMTFHILLQRRKRQQRESACRLPLLEDMIGNRLARLAYVETDRSGCVRKRLRESTNNDSLGAF